MKRLFIYICLLLITLNNAVTADQICTIGRNEIFRELGPNCDRECKSLNEPCRKKGDPHRTGCFCRSNAFARDDENVCVPIVLC